MSMRWEVLINGFPRLIEGLKLTLLLSLEGVVLGALLGLLIGLIRSRKPQGPLSWLGYSLSTIYVEFIRGTPFLIQLYLFYLAPTYLFKTNIPSFYAGLIAVSLNSGAYVSEIFRGAIQGIDKGQMEAARSLGLSYAQAMRSVILPQAFRRALPPLGNEFIMLIKESSVASVIGVQELTFKQKALQAATYEPFPPLIAAAGLYFVLTFTLARVLGVAERRLNYD